MDKGTQTTRRTGPCVVKLGVYMKLTNKFFLALNILIGVIVIPSVHFTVFLSDSSLKYWVWIAFPFFALPASVAAITLLYCIKFIIQPIKKRYICVIRALNGVLVIAYIVCFLLTFVFDVDCFDATFMCPLMMVILWVVELVIGIIYRMMVRNKTSNDLFMQK